jgi:HPt (histidine-containing phosphotransfer) domain-containing protein
MSEPYFDSSALPDLMGLNEPQEQIEFLNFFLEHMETTLGMEPFVGDRLELGEFREKAHMLKSSCRSVGAMLLGKVLEHSEHAAAAGDHGQCLQLREQVHTVFAETVPCIRDEITRLQTPAS